MKAKDAVVSVKTPGVFATIYEQLIAMKQASIICELDKNQLEDIFWRNAVREFNVPWN